jgi:5'-3' exonuclease
MKKNELFKLLDSVVEENDTVSSKKYDRVLLIDGLNLFFRNFAMMNIVNSQGAHVGGLGGFMRSLGSLINQIQPTSVFVVFDGIGSSTNRKNLLPEYKSGRNLTRITNWEVFEDLEDEDDAKISQIVRIAHYLKCLPVRTVAIDKAEADDIIAYYSDILPKAHGSKVFIVSSDKDFIQLVNDDVIVYRPIEKEYYTKDTVKEKFGVLADNFILYKMLLGDNSDKVAGVKGLGEKGLLKKFPELATEILTLDDIFRIAEEKHKEHVVYARVAFERERLEQNYRIMNLKKPLLDDGDKEFLEAFAESDNLALNSEAFLRFYHDDGLGHLIKNVDFWIKDTFKVLNSFK